MQGSLTTGESGQLLSGIQETKNDYLEDLHNDGTMKLSSGSGKYGGEGCNQQWNALLAAIWKTSDGLANKGI